MPKKDNTYSSSWNKIVQFVTGPFQYSSIRKTAVFFLINVIISTGFILWFGKEALGTTISVVLGFFLSKVGLSLYDTVKMILEDKKKCRRDNDFLAKIYKNGHYLHHLNSENDKGFLYEELIPYNNNSLIITIDHPDKMMELDPFIQTYYAEIFGAHKASYVENNITLKLSDVSYSNNIYKISFSRSTYYHHLVTNRAIDFPIKNGLTLRGLFEYGPTLKPLKESKMSNHLGMIAFIELSDGKVIFPKRQTNSTTSKNLITGSIASRVVLDGPEDKITGLEDIEKKLIKTIDKRLGIKLNDDKSSHYQIVFLGLGRDVYEGGKPHFFYYIKINDLNSDDFIKNYRQYQKDMLKKQTDMDMDKMVYLCEINSIELKKNYSVKLKCCQASKKILKHIITVKPEMSFLGAYKHYRDYRKTIE